MDTKDTPMNDLIRSNRDLYRRATSAAVRHEQPGLEGYLLALRHLLAQAPAVEMSSDAFAALLEGAFVTAPEAVSTAVLRTLVDDAGTPAWHRHLAQQIVDLREMAEVGSLEDEQRYFGIDAPSGARWYNFTPGSYIECGIMGAFGGWLPDDDTGRSYVPGKVAAIDETGALVSVNPDELEEEIVPLLRITEDDLIDFLCAGQAYE